MSHRALITGVTGFAGGFLATHLLDCGDAVLGCSHDGAWLAGSDPAVADRVELFAWDLARSDGPDGEARRRIERFRPDVIYHLAALSVQEDCGHDEPTAEAVAVNVEGTRRVLELAASLRRPVRVLFTSSNTVYAPVEPGSARVAEDAPLGPRSAYGKTKLAAEELVRRAAGGQGCEAVIARSFQHTGPHQDYRMMLPSWARQFAAGGRGPVEVYTLDARMDLTDVRDVVRAYRLLAERGRPGEAYNVGRGVEITSGRVFEILHKLADPERPYVQTQPGLRQNPIADNARLVASTGWKAEIPLDKTVADTFCWWKERVEG
jgi:GDP-4-dehydro-6-deoxy-D-mannose reductase